MKGFFSNKEMQAPLRSHDKYQNCYSCGLYRYCNSPKMEPTGGFKKGILNIGDFPSEADDASGKHFQGAEGKLLYRRYKSLGIDLYKDCLNLNAVNCLPLDKNDDVRKPNNKEIVSCRNVVLWAIKEYKPKIIVLHGDYALQSVIGHRWSGGLDNINKWRGHVIPDQDFKTWICPVFSPKYVYDSQYGDIEAIWINDLARIIKHLDVPFKEYIEPKIHYIHDLGILDTIKPGTDIAFDYETTGLKPHAKGHKIICVAVAISPDEVYTFKMPEKPSARAPFIRLLQNPKIGKIAQNMKFEQTWSMVRLKQSVQNWVWDTMLATHQLDNRPGVTGLKFQTYVNFGVIDYSSEVSPYLRVVNNDNGNSLNRIEELTRQPNGLVKLMHYCALDAIFEYRLSELQRAVIDLPF